MYIYIYISNCATVGQKKGEIESGGNGCGEMKVAVVVII